MTEFTNDFSKEIWQLTYKHHSDNTIDDTFKRVAKAIASVEKTVELQEMWSENFYNMMNDFKVVPGGRIIANAGTEWKNTGLSNCYVANNVKNPDSIEGIMALNTIVAELLRSEGGVGITLDILRPRGTFVNGIGVETPGSIKFAEITDKISEVITSGSGFKNKNIKAKGKIRKGAMLCCLSIWHPDINEFITAKQSQGRLTKFNMSVNCSDDFMNKIKKVKQLKDQGLPYVEFDKWDLIFPDTDYINYNEEWDGNITKWINKGYPIIIHETVSALWLWERLMQSAYDRAEPGILFLDRANYLNPGNYMEHIQTTNPCGEEFLAPGGICCLGSLNLTQYINDDGEFDFIKFNLYTQYITRFLDNVNSFSTAPLPIYKWNMENKRRIGIGLMGWGSLLFMLKIPFASNKAHILLEKILKCFTESSIKYSIELSKEKGMFSLCNKEKHAESPYFKNIGLDKSIINDIKKYGIRNSALFAIAPNGNTSIFANCITGGCEPAFLTEYIRTSTVPFIPNEIVNLTPKFYEGQYNETDLFHWVKEGDEDMLKGSFNGITYKIDKNRGLTKETLIEDYGVKYLKDKDIWDENGDYVKTTNNLTVKQHIDDLTLFAKYMDSSCSKTIGIPNEYPFNDFQNVFLDAYNTGYIKGCTVYRSGTMASVLSSTKETKYSNDEEIILDDIKLPDSAPAQMKTLRADSKKWYLSVVMHPESDKPIAFFAHTNHNEKNASTHDAVEKLLQLAKNKGIPERHILDTENKITNENNVAKLCRVISLLLRHGVLIKNVVATLDSIEKMTVGTFLFQIKKFLSSYIRDGEKVENAKCDNCGSTKIVYSQGCLSCLDCSQGKCA